MRMTLRRKWSPGSDGVKMGSDVDSFDEIEFYTYNWDLGPYLGALLWNDGEAHHIVF